MYDIHIHFFNKINYYMLISLLLLKLRHFKFLRFYIILAEVRLKNNFIY